MKRWHANRLCAVITALVTLTALSGCGTVATIGKLQPGAGAEAGRVWDRWIASGGDIAAAVTWERQVKPGVTVAQIEQTFASIAAEHNLRAVGELPLSRELEARSNQPQKLLKIYSYCNPTMARHMVDFSPAMSAFLPCRIALVERDGGLWLYTINMDMMLGMGRRLPPDLLAEARHVRDAVLLMLERGASGDF